MSSVLEKEFSESLEVAGYGVCIFLSVENILSLSLVSKTMKRLVTDERIWRYLFSRDYRNPIIENKTLSNRENYALNRIVVETSKKYNGTSCNAEIRMGRRFLYRKKVSGNPKWSSCILFIQECVAFNTPRIVKNLMRLEIQKMDIKTLPFSPVLTSLRLLKCLQLTEIPLFKTLKHLKIEDCPLISSLPRGMENLETLSVSQSSGLKIVPNDLVKLWYLGFPGGSSIPSTLKNITSLTIANPEIVEIPETLTKLRILDAFGCDRLTKFPTVSLKMLLVGHNRVDAFRYLEAQGVSVR